MRGWALGRMNSPSTACDASNASQAWQRECRFAGEAPAFTTTCELGWML